MQVVLEEDKGGEGSIGGGGVRSNAGERGEIVEWLAGSSWEDERNGGGPGEREVGEEMIGRGRVRVRDFEFFEEAAVAIGAEEIGGGGRGNRDGAIALVAEVLARLAGGTVAAGRRHIYGKRERREDNERRKWERKLYRQRTEQNREKEMRVVAIS